jgi:bifunctional non-homologous end joining protein LigD
MTQDSLTIGNYRIDLSSLDKVLFPNSGITKRDLVEYYRRIADIALPHYRDRPLSMHRFPNGIDHEGFFQKNVPDYFPDWIETVELPKEKGSVRYAVANNAATLVYLANQGCITPHLALSRRDKPDHPDRLIFDLDPSDNDFGKVQWAAARLKDVLEEELELTTFVQTTGSRGLHIVIPIKCTADFDTVRNFAHRLSAEMSARHPDMLTVEQRKSARGNRVFLDYLRNAYGQTTVAPYAVRAREGAPVATPLEWHEALARRLSPQDYTIKNIFRRLGQRDDPWARIDDRAVGLGPAMDRLESTQTYQSRRS